MGSEVDGNAGAVPWRVSRASEEIRALLEMMAERPVTWGELVARMGDRADLLVIVLLTLPFAVGVPLPGISTLAGLLIVMAGVHLGLGRKPWLPQRFLRARVSPRTSGRILRGAGKLLAFFEKVLGPRWPGVVGGARYRWAHASSLVVMAVLLALPVFVPFTNIAPGLGILMLALGLMERDGRMLALGHIAMLLNLVFFGYLAWGMLAGIDWALKLWPKGVAQ